MGLNVTATADQVFRPSGPDRPNGLFAHGSWNITSTVESLPGGKEWPVTPLRVEVEKLCDPDNQTPDDGSDGCRCNTETVVGGVECGSEDVHEPVLVEDDCACFVPVKVRTALTRIGLRRDSAVLSRRAQLSVLHLLETALERTLAAGGVSGDCVQPALFDPEKIPAWASDGGVPIPMALATALGDLEQLVIESGGGVIHAPYRLAERLLAARLVVASGSTASTAAANVPVVFGAGYPASTIANVDETVTLTAAAGEAWLAASGPVSWAKEPVPHVVEVTTPTKNERSVWASQSAMAVWSQKPHAVVLTAEQGCC